MGWPTTNALRNWSSDLLRFVAFYSFFDAMFVVFNSAIRGAGDTRFAPCFRSRWACCCWCCPRTIASRFGPKDFRVAWYAVTLFITVLGLGFMARFSQGRWKSMRVIEHTPPELPTVSRRDEASRLPAAAVVLAANCASREGCSLFRVLQVGLAFVVQHRTKKMVAAHGHQSGEQPKELSTVRSSFAAEREMRPADCRMSRTTAKSS